MSMNLNCKSGGVTIPLRQTPTQITDMCMVQPNGKVAWEVSGSKARHALAIYCEWLRGSLNGAYFSAEDANHARNEVSTEIAKIQRVIKKRKVLVVFKM